MRKSAKSKILNSRGHVSGQLDVKCLDFDGPKMLKFPIWIIMDPKPSKLKILTFRPRLSGWLDAKSFDLDVPGMLKSSIWMFLGLKCLQIGTFVHSRVMCRVGWMLKALILMNFRCWSL